MAMDVRLKKGKSGDEGHNGTQHDYGVRCYRRLQCFLRGRTIRHRSLHCMIAGYLRDLARSRCSETIFQVVEFS